MFFMDRSRFGLNSVVIGVNGKSFRAFAAETIAILSSRVKRDFILSIFSDCFELVVFVFE